MSRSRLVPIPALTVLTALAVAAPGAVAAPSVTDRLANADRALASASTHAKAGRDAVALRAARRADSQTDAAMRRTRHGSRSTRALDARRIAAQYQQNAEGIARLVIHLEGGADAAAAKAVTASTDGRAIALDRLKMLAGRLPVPAQKGLGRAVTALTTAGPKPAATLDRALRTGAVDTAAIPAVDAAILGVAVASASDVGRLDALAGLLPAAARRGMEAARARITGVLGEMGARFTGAQDCAAERDADPAAFDEKYRRNGDEADEQSNAYGMCVSGRAKAMRPGVGWRPAGLPGPPVSLPSVVPSSPSVAPAVPSVIPGTDGANETPGSPLSGLLPFLGR